MIMVTVFKRGEMIGTDVDVVNIVDDIIPTLLDNQWNIPSNHWHGMAYGESHM